MCLSPVLIKFTNPLGRNFLYGLGGFHDKTIPKKHGKVYHRLAGGCLDCEKTVPPFLPLPQFTDAKHLGSNYRLDPSAFATLYNMPIFIRKPSLDEVAKAAQDNPLGIPSRTSGFYTYFRICEPEADVVCMYVPCGKCIQCVNARVNEWTFRLTRDLQTTRDCVAFFCTLTYNPKHLPTDAALSSRPYTLLDNLTREIKTAKGIKRKKLLARLVMLKCALCGVKNGYVHNADGLINYADFQLFIKRFRELLRRWYSIELSYFVCGEYGKTTARPHFHCIIWFSKTEKMAGYDYFAKLRGKKTLFSTYIDKYKRVPALTDGLFKKLMFYTYGLCDKLAFRCDPVRSSGGAARYICKYMSKNLLFMPHNLATRRNVLCVPPCYHRSCGLAYNWAEKFAAALTDPDRPFESINVKYDKDGHTYEYTQNIPSILYRHARDFIHARWWTELVEDGVWHDYDVCSSAKWITPRCERFHLHDDQDRDPLQMFQRLDKSLRLSNLQMVKYDE